LTVRQWRSALYRAALALARQRRLLLHLPSRPVARLWRLLGLRLVERRQQARLLLELLLPALRRLALQRLELQRQLEQLVQPAFSAL
jgi:hypothetical protein